MDETPRYANAGGFVQPTLPSPAPSTASSRAAAGLPHPRLKPLVPGSRKEDYARKYAESRLLHISRRYVKKHGIPDPTDTVKGYDNFEELCHDLEEVIFVLWFSGTPSIQVPYLLNIALAFTEYIEAFDPAPTATFSLLKKLDHCFASLLAGKDIKSGETLPGFEQNTRKGITKTDMVRLKSLAEQTRLLIAVVMSNVDEVETYLPEEDEYVPPSRGQATPHGEKRKRIAEETPENTAVKSEVKEESASPPKRQKTESPENKTAAESPLVKSEDADDEMSTPVPSTLFSKENLTGMSSSKNDGKFHFSLEDEDDDEDDVGETATPAVLARTPPHRNASEEPADLPPDAYEPDDDGDDDDDELYMNVAKVYEKTLVALGSSLGEPIVGY
ncbi:meiotic recombination protein DMC1 [Apiospora saccharicola]|uniref:Meiotic recombination protein DMC1 n=1 Tax=Apiospora saccharicola TaxID=335842 RepID=A0ABR1UX09_9PEZI